MPAEDMLAAVIVGLIFVLLTVFLGLVARHERRDRELLHAERMALLEKGLPLPPQLLPTPEPPAGAPFASSDEAALQVALKRLPTSSLKTGLTTLALGIGVVLAFVLAQPEWGHWAWGLVLMLAGAAHLAYWVAGGRDEWEQGRAFEEQARRRVVGGRLAGDGPADSSDSKRA